MGFISFIKNAGKKIGEGILNAGKFIGEKVAPVVHGIASAVGKYAPYASALAGGLGVPELGAALGGIGRVANKVADFTKGTPPAQPPPAQPPPKPGMNASASGRKL
jgi:hypothetical protein